ncbi:MAG: hypothetical protein JW888_15880 [Pirellulales bacterium]|nr:hypothetical protein [Pirellulales bacterium]
MFRITSSTAAGLLVLMSLVGCTGSSSDGANERVEQLTQWAAASFERGQLDKAQHTIDEALAVEGATQTDKAAALATRIKAERRRVEAEQFDHKAAELLNKAVAMSETESPEAIVVDVANSIPQATATQRELARALLQRLRKVTVDDGAVAYWNTFDLAALTDFRERDRLPEQWQSAVEEGTPHDDALRQLWQATLRRTLPDALAAAEIQADVVVDPDHSLPAPTIEEVAANPEAWLNKKVQFDRVWIDGRLHTSMRHGRLMTVTSPAGNVHGPYIEDGVLVFSTYSDVAGQLQSLISPDGKAQGRLFCKIVRARRSGPIKATLFFRAMVYKMELYSETPEEETRR